MKKSVTIRNLHKGDEIKWVLKYTHNQTDYTYYKDVEKTISVGGSDITIETDPSTIKGEKHKFKLFEKDPFNGGVVLNFLGKEITKNEEEFIYGDRVDMSKDVNEDIIWTAKKTGYSVSGSFKNYVITSNKRDKPIIANELIFNNDDLVAQNIKVMTLNNYDGGNMDSYQFKLNDNSSIVVVTKNEIHITCKLKDKITFIAQRGKNKYEKDIIITENMIKTKDTGESFDFEILNMDFEIHVDGKPIKSVTEIGYGYDINDRQHLIEYISPSVKNVVEIKSNINDLDLSGYYDIGDDDSSGVISFISNETTEDKHYVLTFSAPYYKDYEWTFIQRHAELGNISWEPKTINYDKFSSDATGIIQITEATGTLTPEYEVLNVRYDSSPDQDAYNTSLFKSMLNKVNGSFTIGGNDIKTGEYTIRMKVVGKANNIYKRPSNGYTIQRTFVININ